MSVVSEACHDSPNQTKRKEKKKPPVKKKLFNNFLGNNIPSTRNNAADQQQMSLGITHFQSVKSMTNGATLIKIGAAEPHVLLPWCNDHPAPLVGVDAAGVTATADALVPSPLLLLELLVPVVPVVRPVVVAAAAVGFVSFGSGAVVVSALVGVPVVVNGDGVWEPTSIRDVGEKVRLGPEGTAEDELLSVEAGGEIAVMAKTGLVSPESPNTKKKSDKPFFFLMLGLGHDMELTDNKVIVSWWYIWNGEGHIASCDVETLCKRIVWIKKKLVNLTRDIIAGEVLFARSHCAQLIPIWTAAVMHAVILTTAGGPCDCHNRQKKKAHSLKSRFKLLLSLKPRMIWAARFVIWETGGRLEVSL